MRKLFLRQQPADRLLWLELSVFLILEQSEPHLRFAGVHVENILPPVSPGGKDRRGRECVHEPFDRQLLQWRCRGHKDRPR